MIRILAAVVGRLSSLPTIERRAIGVLLRRFGTPINFAMGPSPNFLFCRLSGNSKSFVISSIRCCGTAAIAPEESDPLLKLAKAKEMLAAGDLEDAATMCADAAEEAVASLEKDLELKIPEDMSTYQLLHFCDRCYPDKKDLYGVEFWIDYVMAQQLRDAETYPRTANVANLRFSIEMVENFIRALQAIDRKYVAAKLKNV